MYIAPSTSIIFLKDVPLDADYTNTIRFEDTYAQEQYFRSKAYLTVSEYSYQRVGSNELTVALSVEHLQNCNYLMFNNTNYGNKWFYAFIVGEPEYINNETTKIHYKIDVIQSWMLNCEFMQCFVAREMSEHDIIGENTQPENVELGEYVYDQNIITAIDNPIAKTAIVYASFDTNMSPVQGGIFSGLYTGVRPIVFNVVNADGTTNYAEVNNLNIFLENAVTNLKESGIVSVTMMPTSLVSSNPNNPYIKVFEKYIDKNYSNIGGYYPKNKKLFTFPYNFLSCDNNQGITAEYHYEDFFNETGKAHFYIASTTAPNASTWLVPMTYKGATYAWNEAIQLSCACNCSFNIDSFKAYLAQNMGVTATDMIGKAQEWIGNTSADTKIMRGVKESISSMLNGIQDVAMPLGALGVTEGIPIIDGVVDAIQRQYVYSHKPPQNRGDIAGNFNMAAGLVNFFFYYKHIKPEYAEMIDNFFSMFGYATNKLKIPNISSRPHWNYLRCAVANVKGQAPASAIVELEHIFENGITFWANGDEIGNYSLDNSPLG